MSSHELAKKLLELPDLPVTVYDGMDPSDPQEVADIIERTGVYWNDGTPIEAKHWFLR